MTNNAIKPEDTKKDAKIGVIVAGAGAEDTIMLSKRLSMMGYAVENMIDQDGLSLKAPRDHSRPQIKAEEFDLYGGKYQERIRRKKERREHLKIVQMEALTRKGKR